MIGRTVHGTRIIVGEFSRPETLRLGLKIRASNVYQINLLRGRQKWSGSDLRGLAREYGSRYAEARNSLIRRAKALALWDGSGWRVDFITIDKEKRLCWISPSGKRAVLIDWYEV